MWYPIELTRNSVFDYVAYETDKRVLRVRVVGGPVQEFGAVPFEVAKAFPTGITGLGFVLAYVKGRYPVNRDCDPAEDENYPVQMVNAAGETIEINPRARKIMAADRKAKRATKDGTSS